MPERQSLAYDPSFDTQAYYSLETSSNVTSIEEYKRKQEQLDTRTRINLETNLGERYNVELATSTYQIVNGKIQNSQHDEPFEEIIKRGVEHRKIYGNPHDHERERAELAGFQKVQKALSSPDFTDKIVIISPSGTEKSSYQHNFFDIWQKDKKGLVHMSRYTSKNNLAEHFNSAQELNSAFPSTFELNDSHFLAHPVITSESTEDILAKLNPQEETMTTKEYQKLIEACTPLILNYINNPTIEAYNAILVGADKHVFEPELLKNLIASQPIEYIIQSFAQIPVRTVSTSCGSQSGFTTRSEIISGLLPFSVSDFGTFQEDTSDFPCPRCGHIIKYGSGTKECPECGLKATCA